MASEKAEMSHDTESLPPQYASSESAFSDSPPPAYRKTNTVRLQITRIVCTTVLLSGFLTGFFILTHSWINSRHECNCPEVFHQLPSSDRLVQAGVLPDFAIQQDIAPKMKEMSNAVDEVESRQVDIPLPLDKDEVEEDLEIAEKVMEEEIKELQDVAEEGKRVKLPIDMLLGNPALAGKDVQCKVEKKIHNLGNGILSKTIMVTCDDENNDSDESKPQLTSQVKLSPMNEAFNSARPMPRPPMSLLAPILKMMASRANARLQRQMNQPKVVLRRFPQSMGPFPQAIKGPMRFSSPSLQSMNGPPHPPHGHFHRPIFTPISQVPEEMEFMHQRSEDPRPMPFENMQGEDEHPPKNMLFREDFDREQHQQPLVFRRFPSPQPRPDDEDEMMIRKDNPVKVIRGFPPQIPDAIKQIVSKIINDGAGSDDEQKTPVIAIKAFPQMRSFDDLPAENKMMLPFPFRAVRVQNRGARKLNLQDDEFAHASPFPLPRGALSAPLQPVEVPEAEGRALDSPVTIPAPQESSPLRFFPGRLVRVPMPLPEGRAITHMEMRENPTNEIPIEIEEIDNQEDHHQQQQELEHTEITNEDTSLVASDDLLNQNNHFGPPRDHSVIEDPQSPIQLLGSPDEVPSFLSHMPPPPPYPQVLISSHMPPTQTHTISSSHMPPPPPPSYAREGRVGVVEEINPDAEMIQEADAPEHHRISVE